MIPEIVKKGDERLQLLREDGGEGNTVYVSHCGWIVLSAPSLLLLLVVVVMVMVVVLCLPSS